MPPPEPSDGWLAQLLYLGSLGFAGMVAWLSRYRSGRDSERGADEDRVGRLVRKKPEAEAGADTNYVVLEAAELADMRAVRMVLPQLELVVTRLADVFRIVEENQRVIGDNHRIIEDNNRIVATNQQILVILQRIAHKMDVDEEVEARLQRQQVEELVRGKKGERD